MPKTALPTARLEIGLHRADSGSYRVELRFSTPTSDAEMPTVRGDAPLDIDALRALQLDPSAYGQRLSDDLFADAAIRGVYDRARVAVDAAELRWQVRLDVGPSVPELHALRWELLRDPIDGSSLGTSETVSLCRFVRIEDWRPVRLRPRATLTALIAVSAPDDVERFGLAPVDAAGEVERARAALIGGAGSPTGVRVVVAGLDEPLTSAGLIEHLRAGVDVLYLVAHGVFHRRTAEPYLFLQDEAGSTARVAAGEWCERIAELAVPPRLVVLASCESAGTEDGVDADGRATIQASLAPRLAAAGVPAIVAMQGQITMATVERAMPVFFRELVRDGRIDRALGVARAAVRERPDAWMPALFLRLKSGTIWYEPGFASAVGEGADAEFKRWRSICHSVRQGRFVPIIGPVLDEHVRGAQSELAERLADRHAFPFARHERGSLVKVAQFLTTQESRAFAHGELLDTLRHLIIERNPQITTTLETDDLKSVFKALMAWRYENPDDPFRILAELPAAIFVNAGHDPLLPLAIARAGKRPRPLASPWRKTKDSHPREPDVPDEPSVDAPLVYYPFGFVGQPDTLVVTEDDTLDYLIAAADYKLIPRAVRGTVVESSLLFLGFSLDALSFRVLYRLLAALDGSSRLGDFTHVGVQIDPSEADLIDVEQARANLQAYFAASRDMAPVDIYWGTATDFLESLRDELERVDAVPAAVPVADDAEDWIVV